MSYAYETKKYKELQRKYQQLEGYYTECKKKNEKLKTQINELEKWKKYPSDETKVIIRKLQEENEKMKQALKNIATSAAPFKASMYNLKI